MAVWRDVRTWAAARPLVTDAVFAVALVAVEYCLWALSPDEVREAASLGGWAWVALGTTPIVMRRRWPWAAALVCAVHNTLAGVLHLPYESLAILVVTYTLAAYRPLRDAVVGSVLMWVPAMVVAALYGRYQDPPVPLSFWYFLSFNTLGALVAFLTGRTVFARRRYVATLVEQARTAEQNQQALSAQAVADERRRIARELHDVVAHHVSVMGVLATGTRRALPRDPRAADEALATIEETGRVALREMRRLLFVLRSDAEPAGELEPQPGLPGIDGLLEQIRDAGLPVELIVTGDPGRLDPGIALAVYRITQEALTNALKHAGPASAEVRLTFTPKELTIEISDTGRGPRPGLAAGEAVPGPLPVSLGHGLLGMRERINLYGGTLRAGARSGGGFRVAARIPLEPEFTAYSVEKDLLA